MHAPRPPGFGIQGALEHRPEDGGRNEAPVEVHRCVLQQQHTYLLGEARNLYLFGEQTAIGVGECCEAFTHVWVAVLGLGVEHLEEPYQFGPHGVGVELRQVVVEHVVSSENSSILGIEAKHQTHAENVQRPHGRRLRRVNVLLDERIVELADNLSRLH